MTDSEILQKAYYKAKKNGYDCKWSDLTRAIECERVIYFELAKNFYGQEIDKYKIRKKTKWFSIWDLLNDHDFAKAFWGENKIITDEGKIYETAHKDAKDTKTNFPNLVIWQYHLQKLVLEKEPLKYLERFL